MIKTFPQWIVAAVISLLSLGLSVYAAYAHNDKELSNRITAVEVQQKNDTPRLDRIENKVDQILERLSYGQAQR